MWWRASFTIDLIEELVRRESECGTASARNHSWGHPLVEVIRNLPRSVCSGHNDGWDASESPYR